jgi:hypothetical protein
MTATRDTTVTLTHEDAAKLNAPFDLDDHEFLRGFTYITELAICARLDTVDPAWTFEIKNIIERDSAVTVHGVLTVKGVSRDGVGSDVIRDKNEPIKSAATDALKRAARLFGIGRSLVGLERNVKYDERTLKKWLENKFGKPAVTNQPTGPWSNAERMVDFHEAIQKRFPEVSQSEIASAVGIKKYTDYAAWNQQFDSGQEAGAAVIVALQKAMDSKPQAQQQLIDAPEGDSDKAQYDESFS